MKYDPDAYLDYPILRPNSSDYPSGSISTYLRPPTSSDGSLNFELSFDITEPAITKLIEKEDAACCALLYCITTCYSQMLRASSGSTVVAAVVPLDRLSGRVAIHPSVITTDVADVRSATAHPEYGNSAISVERHRQLAMDEPWHFAVGFVGEIESIFRLQQDDTEAVDDDESESDADQSQRHIVIRANPKTYRAFQDVRSHLRLTKATVYLNALRTALSFLNPEPEVDEGPEGCAATVRAHMEKQDIKWPDPCSHGLAAQRLLNRLLESLTFLSANLLHEDDS